MTFHSSVAAAKKFPLNIGRIKIEEKTKHRHKIFFNG
jgi:hypothetical protein